MFIPPNAESQLEPKQPGGGGGLKAGQHAPLQPGGAIPRLKANPASVAESLSLRQRAPAMLLKKLDEFEEKAQRVWAKHEMQRHEDIENSRKAWGNR